MHCTEVIAWEIGARDFRLPSGFEVPVSSQTLDDSSQLAISHDTVIVQARTENPDDVVFLGFICVGGLYTPANLLGLVKFLQNDHKAIVRPETKALLSRATTGVLSDIRSPFVGKAPLMQTNHSLE